MEGARVKAEAREKAFNDAREEGETGEDAKAEYADMRHA